MLFVAVEKYKNQDARAVYERFGRYGRMMPDGLKVVGSWVSADLGRCFMVVETDEAALLQKWAVAWSDLVEFEIVPVTESATCVAALESV